MLTAVLRTLQIKLDLILDWFVCFEALLYLTLILSRLRAPARPLQGVLICAVVLYTLSRLMQTVILAYFFAASYGRMKRAGQQDVYWPCAVLSFFLSVLQLYTGLIYYRLYRRTGNKARVTDSHQFESPFQDAPHERRSCIDIQHHKSAAF